MKEDNTVKKYWSSLLAHIEIRTLFFLLIFANLFQTRVGYQILLCFTKSFSPHYDSKFLCLLQRGMDHLWTILNDSLVELKMILRFHPHFLSRKICK